MSFYTERFEQRQLVLRRFKCGRRGELKHLNAQQFCLCINAKSIPLGDLFPDAIELVIQYSYLMHQRYIGGSVGGGCS